MQLEEYKAFVNELMGHLNYLDERSAKEILQKLKTNFDIECDRFKVGLPIYAKKSQILSVINKHRVTILTAETGSGKSTQVVQYLHENNKDAKIVCTQPRKVAATSLASRVSDELHSSVGELVGYRVGARYSSNRNTRIFYVTDHTLLNECLDDPNLKKYKYIIVDEAHERSIATDLLLAMIKKALRQRKDLRLIISSATIDPKVFEIYFKGMAQRIHVQGRTFPVECIYETVSIGKDYLQIAVDKAKKIHKNEPDGDVLVFLTTPSETERAQDYMLADPTISNNVVCLVLHGRLQPEDQQLIFNRTPVGKRKIVFATNSAETSITIPNIRYVVDSGMVKEKQYDREKNVSLLKISTVNKSSAEQRMGRAGRTQPGKCYRLYTEEEYNGMNDEMKPEILRENLGLAMLKLYQFNIGDPFQYDFVEAPPEIALKYAREELQSLGAIIGNTLTRYGEIMATLDIEPKLGKFVALCIEEGIGYDAMVMAAVCSIGGSVFFRAGTEDEKQISDRLKAQFCHQEGDLYSILDVYKKWYEVPEQSKNQWCVSNSLNAKSLRFTRDLVNDMKGNAENLTQVDIETDFSPEYKLIQLVPRLLSRCFRYSLARFSGHNRGGYFRQNMAKDRFHLHPSSSFSFLSLNPEWVLFIEVLTTQYRSFLLNTIVIPNYIAESSISRDILLNPINLVKTWTVGKELAKVLGLGRWNCTQEKTMQADLSPHIYIDYDPNVGEVKLHCSREDENESVRVLGNAIDFERKWIELKTLDIPLSDGNTTCVLLEKGGLCKQILFQGEFNGLLLRGIDDSIRRETVAWFFSTFGEIIEVTKFRSTYWWGKVCYKTPKEALNAIRKYRRRIDEEEFLDFEKLYVKPAFNQEVLRSNSFQTTCVRALWTRRPARGNFGFITFKEESDYDEFVGTRQYVGGNLYEFKRSKEVLSVKVVGISPYISNKELELSFENQFPEMEGKIEKYVIPRVAQILETPEVLGAKRRQLFNKVRQLLDDNTDVNERRFDVEMKSINSGKEIEYEAKISFKNARDAQAVITGSIAVGNAKVRFVPELKSPPHYTSTTLYHFIKDDLKLSFNKMPHVVLQTNQISKGRNPSVELAVEAKQMDYLVEATKVLKNSVKGEHVQFTEQQFRYFSTPVGYEFINSLKKHNSCIINIERRLRSIVIFGNEQIRTGVKKLVEEKKNLASLKEDEWEMRLDELPNGFIKKLIKTYNVNFESLYNNTGVSYIAINTVRRIITFSGSRENLNKCKKAMDDLVEQIDPNKKKKDGERGECPICFDTLETTNHQLEICSHFYCKECFQMMCLNAIQSKELPLKCAQDKCQQLISINDMIEYLEPKDTVPIAVERLLATNKDMYKYCITPDCLNIYKSSVTTDPEPFHCTVCQTQICTFCDEEYHAGLPCHFSQRKEDDNIKQWLADYDKNRGLCPSCSAPIDKFAGCLHVTCLVCKKHVCWRCKKAFFQTSKECYDHLSLCGGIF